MLREVQRVGISEDADGVVDAESADGVGVTLGVPAMLSVSYVLATGAGARDGSGVPKAGMTGAIEEGVFVLRLVKSPSSRRANTAARAAEVFATFLLEKPAV